MVSIRAEKEPGILKTVFRTNTSPSITVWVKFKHHLPLSVQKKIIKNKKKTKEKKYRYNNYLLFHFEVDRGSKCPL